MPDIWLIRHGQAGDVLGDYDRLSERGELQSRLAGEAWGHLGEVHRVLTGDMRRHRETRAAFAEAFPGATPEPHVDARWNEFNHHGVFEAGIAAGLEPPKTREDAGRFFGLAMSRWILGEGEYPESYVDFHARVVEGFEALVERMSSGERALVFTSGGAIAAVVRHAMGLEPLGALRVNAVLVNTSFTRVRVGRFGAGLHSMNVYSHLDGRPELVTLT